VTLSAHEVVVLLDEAERVWRGPAAVAVVHLALREEALGVRASWALLRSAWSESCAAVVGAEASLSSLVSFAAVANALASREHLACLALDATHALERVYVEGGCSYWSSRLEDSELLLIEDL